jgi:hypothetical protein
MKDPVLPHGHDLWASVPAPLAGEKRREKTLIGFSP